ncbi:hypothetical protein PQ455_14345 [Sphingomonas naphthae]|uniref:ABC transporter permease n=1 Tax=Sphingomonas naphthae TaxID=1813468 RepID=A0ABY7TJB0_9SPHN|nr:hypothetical protein [Sphingomonas naphthae]WCT72807.1 hypothetical protein PQ455_14345 [Sphingomonas naphthae]
MVKVIAAVPPRTAMLPAERIVPVLVSRRLFVASIAAPIPLFVISPLLVMIGLEAGKLIVPTRPFDRIDPLFATVPG